MHKLNKYRKKTKWSERETGGEREQKTVAKRKYLCVDKISAYTLVAYFNFYLV